MDQRLNWRKAHSSQLVGRRAVNGLIYQDETGAMWLPDASGIYQKQGAVSSDVHPGYVFYIPGRQGVGVPVDRSGKNRNAIRKSGLTEAQCWATAGYMATVGDGAGSDNGVIAVVDPAVAIDTTKDVAVIHGRFKMATPAANIPLFGLGNNPVAHGPYASARATGKLLVGIAYEGNQLFSTGEIGGTVFDNTEHSIGIVVDGPNKILLVYIDGGLAYVSAQNAFGAFTTAPTGFAIGAAHYQAASQESNAVVVREMHYLKLTSMPLNMDDIMLKLATTSGALVTTDVKAA